MPGVNARHVIALVDYSEETIECSCGAVVTGERDDFSYDRHGPLVQAWNEHKLGSEAAGRAATKLQLRKLRAETP